MNNLIKIMVLQAIEPRLSVAGGSRVTRQRQLGGKEGRRKKLLQPVNRPRDPGFFTVRASCHLNKVFDLISFDNFS